MEEIAQNQPPASIQTPPPTVLEPIKKPFLSKAIIVVFIIVSILILLPAGAYLALNSHKQVACTAEAKICPDGSSVGRTGPKCEFTACPKTKPTPTPDPTANWKTYTSTKYGFSIKYPSDYRLDDFGSGKDYIQDFCLFAIGSEGGCFMRIDLYSDNIDNHIKKLDGGSNYKLVVREYSIAGNKGKIVEYRALHDNSVIHFNQIYFESFFLQRESFLFELFANGWDSADYPTINYAGIFNTMLSTLRFIDQASPASNAASATSTCSPRPACLDATPKCMIPETSDMCPPKVTPSP